MSKNSDKGFGQNLIDDGEVTVSHIYKLKKDQLKKLFDRSQQTRLDDLKDHGSTTGILRKLASNENTGIIGDSKDLRRRVKMYGINQKPLPVMNTFAESFKEVMVTDKTWLAVAATALISGVCGAISLGWHGLTEGICIVIMAILMLFISSAADYVKDRKFVTLQSMIKDEDIPVIRGRQGATQTISVWNLVVGDVILIHTGQRVPADCLVIDSQELMVQEQPPKNASEGEYSEETIDNHISKQAVGPDDGIGSQKDPFLYSDSLVIRGKCTAVVCAVGQESTRGKYEDKLDTTIGTPLQKKLNNLNDQFTLHAIYVALVIFVILMITMFIQILTAEDNDVKEADDQTPMKILIKKLPEGISLIAVIIVVSIPEGLPLTIGISLAFSVSKMFGHKILVRKLEAPEKMGGVEEIICSKTGTITTGNMRVAQFISEQKSVKNTRKNTLLQCEMSQSTLERIKDGILYNCDARVEMDATTWVPKGNSTEVGFLRFLQDADIPIHILIQRKCGRIKAQSPFSSEKKRSAVALDHPEKPGTVCVHVKGAPEVILSMCGTMANGDRDAELGEEEIQKIDSQVRQMSSDKLRVIAFATFEVTREEWEPRFARENINYDFEEALNSGEFHDKMCFVGAFGMKDPIRPGVPANVKEARDNNFTVRMVSGDHFETAKSIAFKAGILRQEDLKNNFSIMDATEFRATVGSIVEKYDNNENTLKELEKMDAFREVAKNLKVLARATSIDKNLLVVGLKALDKCVTVTGEGINDVAALMAADVGLAMGNGCSAAKDQADIILTDNDFGACLRSIMWGRNIFHNVIRFLQFQMTVNLSALMTIAIGALIFAQSPLVPVQLLWINLIMDTFAALALATEPPTKAILNGAPIKTSDDQRSQLLSPWVMRQILGISAWNTLIMVILMSFGQIMAGLDYTLSCPLNRTKPDYQDSKYPDGVNEPKYISDYGHYMESVQKKTHFTYIFNTFVFLQIFNEINCRKVGAKEINVFDSFLHNYYFLFVVFGTFAGQFFISEYMGWLFNTVSISKSEWGSCILIGASPLLIALILKKTPEHWVERIPIGSLVDENKETDNRVLNMYKAVSQAQRDPNTAEADLLVDYDHKADEQNEFRADNDFQNV